MRSSLASGKSSTPPARCIHRPQRDTSSAEYRLFVSLASVGASRELSSRRSPALIPHTCAASPTFRYGAFLFVVFALADLSSARLAIYGNRSNRRFTTVPRGLSPVVFQVSVVFYYGNLEPVGPCCLCWLQHPCWLYDKSLSPHEDIEIP